MKCCMRYNVFFSVIPFGAINEFVDFYEIFTFYVNKCEPELYNGCTPLKKVDHGENYQLGMVKQFIDI